MKYNKGIFKNCKRTGNSELTNDILLFSLMFYIAEQLQHLHIFGQFSMNLKILLCLPATSVVNGPFLL